MIDFYYEHQPSVALAAYDLAGEHE